ncbi:riboflavin biosynthesis protein RibD [Deinococcus maricopensis DSM 21211]|uniref:Riboflavin biosynthesis protein RibD n=2 Tax=Deinococcus TaxID=1298 RepID=E8UBD0_DEIML|nr:riboflavin biosynthesis protein RibD [Deinococcus maricopensis DSM 21211]
MHFMHQALQQAALGLGRTAPNPPVGCVIVAGGEVVGRGFHPRAGQGHAEVFALQDAGVRARGATAYVTLEPCSHTGRTPPCADALIRAGVARVVVAALDPNPVVAGRGVARLRTHGLDVHVGPLADAAVRQQAGFRSLITRGRPWVVYKYAATLDGKISADDARPLPVSGPDARALVHTWRNEFDAIAVGVGTVLADDPHLTTRGVPGGRDPRPIVFDRHARTPTTARALRPGTVLVTGPDARTDAHEAAGAHVLRAPTLHEALQGLGALGVTSLLLEGGARLASALYAADLIDEVRAFIAPTLLGAGLPALTSPAAHAPRALHDVQATRVGTDVLIEGFLTAIPRVDARAEE